VVSVSLICLLLDKGLVLTQETTAPMVAVLEVVVVSCGSVCLVSDGG